MVLSRLVACKLDDAISQVLDEPVAMMLQQKPTESMASFDFDKIQIHF